MYLKYVTCSGVNETTDIRKLLKLLKKYPFAEIGIQVNEKKCDWHSARMDWLKALYNQIRFHKIPCSTSKHGYKFQVINAALHVNPSWVEDFGQGIVAPELQTLLSWVNTEGDSFFQRVQLNFKIGRDRTPDEYKLLSLMQLYKTHRFIFSLNENNRQFISKMYRLCNEVGVVFDILHDNSHGEGIIPVKRPAIIPQLDKKCCQGYAGGISANNVEDVLDEIFNNEDKVSFCTCVSVDAEKRLKVDNHLDLELCEKYLAAAKRWRIAF